MKQLLFIYTYFFIDAFLENFYRIYQYAMGYELSYERAMDMWNACLSIRCVMVYPAVLLLQKFRVTRFDFWERLVIVVCGIFAAIDSLDWFFNFQMRSDGMDWIVFLTVNAGILFTRYFFKRKNTIISEPPIS